MCWMNISCVCTKLHSKPPPEKKKSSISHGRADLEEIQHATGRASTYFLSTGSARSSPFVKLWCSNILLLPLIDWQREEQPPSRPWEWGQHEWVIRFRRVYRLRYSKRVCVEEENQIRAVHKLFLIDCRCILQRSLEVNYCIMERFDIGRLGKEFLFFHPNPEIPSRGGD